VADASYQNHPQVGAQRPLPNLFVIYDLALALPLQQKKLETEKPVTPGLTADGLGWYKDATRASSPPGSSLGLVTAARRSVYRHIIT
jgi:hypothetical protein